MEYFLNGISLRPYVTGSAQPKLTQKAMNRIPVALAPDREAAEIVRGVVEKMDFSMGVETARSESSRRLPPLNQSILAKAFRGELVPQDPNDEPARVLLERIRAERAAAATETRKSKGKR